MTQSAQPNTPQDQKIVSLGIKGIITALCTQSLKYSEIFKLNSVSIKLFSLQNLRYFNVHIDRGRHLGITRRP